MRILEIQIEEFGKLRARSFRFENGINLLFGENESGKSTLLAFLRFAFYGFPRRVGAEGAERDKRLSWQGHRAAGSLLFEDEGAQYRITRSVARQGSATRESFSEQLRVISLPDGADVPLNGKTPGEHFLGLPAALYDSTMCLRQSDAARVSSPEVGEAMGELLFAGAAGSRAEAAAERLRLARRELQHQKGDGGRLSELRTQILTCEQTLEKAKESAVALYGCRAAAESYRVQIEEQRRRLDSINASFEHTGTLQALRLFDDVHEAEQALAQKKQELEQLQALHAEKLRASERIQELEEAVQAHTSAVEAGARMTPVLERARGVRHDEALIDAYALLKERGGVRRVQEEFAASVKRGRRSRVIALAGLCFALLFGALLALLAGGALSRVLSLMPTTTALPDICLVLGATTALLLLLSLFFGLRALRHHGRVRAWCRSMHLTHPAMFRTHLERCAAEAEEKKAHAAMLEDMEQEYTKLVKDTLAAESCVREVLTLAGYSAEQCDVDHAPALLQRLERESTQAKAELEQARAASESANAVLEALRRRTQGYDEQELRARVAAVSAQIEPDATQGEDPKQKQERLRRSILDLESKRAELEREEATLSAAAKDPAEVQAELQTLYGERAKAEHRLAALNLALEAMDEAVDSLHKGVTPKLCELASTYFERLTDGTYQRLYPAADLSLMLDSDKGPLPLSHFSAGCQDAAHLSLRLALLETVTSKRLPLLFDEAFARLDDTRTKTLLEQLCRHAEDGGQCLLFTCHQREAEMLSDTDYRYIAL